MAKPGDPLEKQGMNIYLFKSQLSFLWLSIRYEFYSFENSMHNFFKDSLFSKTAIQFMTGLSVITLIELQFFI